MTLVHSASGALIKLCLQIQMTTSKHSGDQSGKRCRTCGLVVSEHKGYHLAPLPPAVSTERGSTRYLRNEPGYRFFEHCSVPDHLRDPRYPLQPGQDHPRRSRKKVQNTTE